jgi:chemotaxis protein MotA
MDIATLFGLILAWGAVFLSLRIEGGALGGLWNFSALVLVIGGSLGATVVGMPINQVKALPGILRQAFFHRLVNPVEMTQAISAYAVRARREGVLALEEEAKSCKSEFLRLGLQLVVDGTPGEMSREILGTEVEAMQGRHRGGEAVFSTLGGFAPTLGILGTVMGLVHMLANLDDPGTMGPAIAAAFIATLYGVGTANLIFLPISNKLKLRSQEETISYQLAIEGILAIQAGENPREVAARMRSFLSPKQKALLEKGGD